jgi:hypothetical protein
MLGLLKPEAMPPKRDSRYDAAGNLIETHEQIGDFKEW